VVVVVVAVQRMTTVMAVAAVAIKFN